MVAGVIRSATVPCTTSGTVTGSLQDTNNNNSFDVGEILTLAFHNCVEPDPVTGNNSTTNGRATFAITQLIGTKPAASPSTPFTAAFKLTFSNFTSRDNVTNLTDSINGDIGFSTSNDGTNTTGTMSGASLRLDSSVDGAFLMTGYDFSFTAANAPTPFTPYSFSVNMTVASVVANGSVTITTPIAFTGAGIADPTAGVMLITGANNSTLTVTANADGSHVGMVVDEDGPGSQPPVTITNPNTLNDYTWAEL